LKDTLQHILFEDDGNPTEISSRQDQHPIQVADDFCRVSMQSIRWDGIKDG